MIPLRPDPLEFLTGRHSGTDRPGGISMPGDGGKFTPDGHALIWPGNTFICHINRKSPQWEAMRDLQEQVKCSEFQRFFAFLTPTSFHMTVFQGLSPDLPASMPDGLAPNTPRDRVSAELMARTRDLVLPTAFRVTTTELFALHSLTTVGADEAAEADLRHARRILRDTTGISPAKFDDYVFHITMAYPLDWVSDTLAQEMADFSAELTADVVEDIGPIDLGAIEFCTFDTMHHFEPLMHLTGRSA